MFREILYTHICYAVGGSEMPNGQNLRPITAAQTVKSLQSSLSEQTGKNTLLLARSSTSAWISQEQVSPGEVLSLTRFSSVKVHFSVTLILEHSMHATCMSELSGQVNPVTNVVRQKSFQGSNSTSTASKNESHCTFDTILHSFCSL